MNAKVQQIFADTVNLSLKTAASGISAFDHDACITLCDFLEEAFPIIHRFNVRSGISPDLPDWDFWVEVLMRCLESDNIMAKIRLLALIYSNWSLFTFETERRRKLCLNRLLCRRTFQRLFHHW